MSETWEATRSSVRRLKTSLANADEDTRYKFAFWILGFAVMGTAIIIQFGYVGASFCFGLLLWKAGQP